MDSMSPETTAIIAIIVAAGSELIGMSSLKSNSWIQLGLQALRLMFPKRR